MPHFVRKPSSSKPCPVTTEQSSLLTEQDMTGSEAEAYYWYGEHRNAVFLDELHHVRKPRQVDLALVPHER